MTPPLLPPVVDSSRSATSFIDVTAKLSLVMGVLSILWSLFQLLLVGLLGQLDIIGWMQQHEMPVPTSMHWISEHMLSMTLLLLLSSVAFLAVSWAMLKRREWGRIGFIVFLVVVAIANFALLPLVQGMFDGMAAIVPPEFLNSPDGQEMRAQLQMSRWTMLITATITAISFAGLHGWLVIKLQRDDVRKQFR